MTKISENDEIIARIQNLRRKATNSASSPAEMEAASALALKLVAKYEISEDQLIEKGVSGIVEDEIMTGRRNVHVLLASVSWNITALTDTKGYHRGGAYIVVGTPLDVEFALYLALLITRTADKAWYKYKDEHYGKSLPPKTRIRLRKSFMDGFATITGTMLNKLKKEKDDDLAKTAAAIKTGTDLISLKNVLIERYVDEEWGGTAGSITLKDIKDLDFHAYGKGADAAKHMDLSKNSSE